MGPGPCCVRVLQEAGEENRFPAEDKAGERLCAASPAGGVGGWSLARPAACGGRSAFVAPAAEGESQNLSLKQSCLSSDSGRGRSSPASQSCLYPPRAWRNQRTPPFSSGYFFFFGHTARHVGSSSRTRDRTWAPAVGAQGLNHWTAREVPLLDTSS